MTPTWQRAWPGISPGGDVGGDVQVSEAYDVRWTHELPNGLHAVVTRAYYVVSANMIEPTAGPFAVQRQTEYLVCTDPRNPGSTELWSDEQYTDLEAVPDTSDEHAKRHANKAPEPTYVEWSAADEHGLYPLAHWHATINIPGYLPMADETPTFDSPRDAWAYLAGERERGEENVPTEMYDISDPDRYEFSEVWTELTDLASADHQDGNPHADNPTGPNGEGTVHGHAPGRRNSETDVGLAYAVSVCADPKCEHLQESE